MAGATAGPARAQSGAPPGNAEAAAVPRAPSPSGPPIRIVVPFAPGGTTDLVARLIAAGLQERLGGTPVLVENRPGAGATLGSQLVAASPPDGTTLVMSNVASHAIGPALYPNVRYDPVRDFTHIALVVSNPSVWVANPRTELHGLADVVRAARGGRGLDVATSGSGSSNHLLVVRFARLARVELNHVPYRGAGPAITDLIAGVVPLMSDSLPSASAHIRQGSVRAIAISSAERHPGFPEVPTFREQGFDLVSGSWFGLSGPAGLPAALAGRLARAVQETLTAPEVRARLIEAGGAPGDLTLAGYTEFVREEHARWGALVRLSGARVE
ncbi:Bug family tripartite tricarboxylate transporter substrate binding protein [Caldovatus aquaticus]|uniref:Tripartite tricarboxylate transporter substrate binding protein n=1 Tax=Caldovatus aquaticus TaxID=2865671 RepID=A0ABS7F4Z4_9PROT|nr:tripartite tricarboxylate transporter substrate-binding protein [Caldovatus aquaticus]MBW8270559.1 tripartite tricarboxylate transporter substrate binding protein [Caldovatus aquaticus]